LAPGRKGEAWTPLWSPQADASNVEDGWVADIDERAQSRQNKGMLGRALKLYIRLLAVEALILVGGAAYRLWLDNFVIANDPEFGPLLTEWAVAIAVAMAVGTVASIAFDRVVKGGRE
jgi:hypothetical protein